MTTKTVRIAFFVLAATCVFAAPAWAQPMFPAGCSNATFTGTYGISFNGIDQKSRLRAAVGEIRANGKGEFSGTVTESKNGAIKSGPISGTYAIDGNCTGSGTTSSNGKVRHYNLVVVSRGSGLELIQTDAGFTEAGFAEAQGKLTCTIAGVKGTYGFGARGTILGVGVVAFNGQFILNGAGKVNGSESGSLNGTIFSNLGLSGTYNINSNCTGSAAVTPKGLSTFHFNFVVVNGGHGMLAIETDGNTVVSGSTQK